MLIYTTCSQVGRNGYYPYFRLENWRVIEDGFTKISPGPGRGFWIRYSDVLFVKISVPLNWFSWGSEFLHPLCRRENFSMIWPNLRHALLPAVAWWVSYSAFLRSTEITPESPSYHFLLLRFCHELKAEKQAYGGLRSFQGKHLSEHMLASGDVVPALRS